MQLRRAPPATCEPPLAAASTHPTAAPGRHSPGFRNLQPGDDDTTHRAWDLIMTHCRFLLSAFATVMTLARIMPCGACVADAVRAASLGHDKASASSVRLRRSSSAETPTPTIDEEDLEGGFPAEFRSGSLSPTGKRPATSVRYRPEAEVRGPSQTTPELTRAAQRHRAE